MVRIYIHDTDTFLDVQYGITLSELARDEKIEHNYPLLGALVNNKVRDMTYRIHKPAIINYFDLSSTYGHDLYMRSLFFVLYKSVKDLFPDADLKILHSISGGKYCEIDNLSFPLTDEVVAQIKARMQKLIDQNIPFERTELPTPDAVRIFKENYLEDKVKLLSNRNRIFTSIYKLGDTINYYYGYLVPSTGYLTLFNLELYESGLLLKIPSRKRPQYLAQTHKLPKLFSVYKEYKSWANSIGVPYVSDVNEKIKRNQVQDIILITEAYHEKMWANIADEIHQHQNIKMILISGPSSSGKTTSCKRLSVQLSILGYQPIQISVDDFFVERGETPKDAEGNLDFESLEAIDLKLFNNVLASLLQGNKVEIPTFNFTTGKKEWKNKMIQLTEKSILVIEGIHCLNPKLTEQIDNSSKFKIFVSALTSISIDRQNPIPTTDNRLIRRIVRDYKYRGYSALETLRRWPSVRNGEERNIFPYQENADVMFNTSLICEMGVLKQYAVAILNEVPETEVEFAEANRLLKFLSYFEVIPENHIPGTSILREFVGGSKFSY